MKFEISEIDYFQYMFNFVIRIAFSANSNFRKSAVISSIKYEYD